MKNANSCFTLNGCGLQGATYGRRMTAPDFARNSQVGGAPPDVNPDEMQTIVWTRDLSKVDPREIEACEDMLDAYFLMVTPASRIKASGFMLGNHWMKGC